MKDKVKFEYAGMAEFSHVTESRNNDLWPSPFSQASAIQNMKARMNRIMGWPINGHLSKGARIFLALLPPIFLPMPPKMLLANTALPPYYRLSIFYPLNTDIYCFFDRFVASLTCRLMVHIGRVLRGLVDARLMFNSILMDETERCASWLKDVYILSSLQRFSYIHAVLVNFWATTALIPTTLTWSSLSKKKGSEMGYRPRPTKNRSKYSLSMTAKIYGIAHSHLSRLAEKGLIAMDSTNRCYKRDRHFIDREEILRFAAENDLVINREIFGDDDACKSIAKNRLSDVRENIRQLSKG